MLNSSVLFRLSLSLLTLAISGAAGAQTKKPVSSGVSASSTTQVQPQKVVGVCAGGSCMPDMPATWHKEWVMSKRINTWLAFPKKAQYLKDLNITPTYKNKY